MTYKTQSEALRPAVQLADTVGARLPSWQDMLGDAERFVRQKPTFSKYIRGTVLENDVPVWIADFAQRLLLRELTLLALRVRAAALEEAAQDEALLRQALEVLGRAHQTAMEQTLRTRVPECSAFAGIAQDLDFVVAALRERLGVKA